MPWRRQLRANRDFLKAKPPPIATSHGDPRPQPSCEVLIQCGHLQLFGQSPREGHRASSVVIRITGRETCSRIGQGMAALGKTVGPSCGKNVPQRSNPRSSPVQVPKWPRHARIDRRRLESGSPSPAKGTRELCQGPLRARHLCPIGSGEGDHQVPEFYPTVPRARALLGGR